jgi:lipoprotein signal peptidase
MPTDTTVQRSTPTSDPRFDVRLADSASDHLSLVQSLTPEQARAFEQLVAALDRANAPLRIGFFALKPADRNAVLEYMVRPVASRKIRTPEHRKVVGLRLDANTVPDGMLPWHYLVWSVIELLTESAMPSERSTLSELRNEITRLIRLHRRDEEAAAQQSAALARRFQGAFPKLILNTISLANSVLLVVIDHVEEADPADVAQWLEASRYFCNAAGCAVMIPGHESRLVEKLNHSAENANGKALLQAWLTRRLDTASPATAAKAAPERAANQSPTPAAPEAARLRDATGHAARATDMPATCARIVRDALQPDVSAIVNAMAQWRGAMQSVVRRAEEGLGGPIPPGLIAKLVALRGLSPALYGAARYDAQMLTSIERALKADASPDAYEDWTNQVAQNARLSALFAAEPAFASIDLRDLATALRLTNVDHAWDAGGSVDSGVMQPGMRLSERAASSSRQAAHTLRAAAQAAEGRFAGRLVLSAALLTTAFSAAAVFLLDRIAKLLIQDSATLLGGLIKAEFLSASTLTGTFWGVGMAVGAELFGLTLAVLIAIFWGDMRHQRSHALSLGLIIGALGANLFDRLAYGGVLNYFHIANLPVFNLSHVALLAGALLLAYSLLRATLTDTPDNPSLAREPARETRRGTGSN